MNILTITTTIAFVFAGIRTGTSEFLDSCEPPKLLGLKGRYDRLFYIEASCHALNDSLTFWTQLDLNNCLGWNTQNCVWGPPSFGRFTDSCIDCTIVNPPRMVPDGNIDCYCVCDANGTWNNTRIPLGKYITFSSSSFLREEAFLY